MEQSRATRIMHAHFSWAIKEPSEYMKFLIDEQNPSTWYILLHGMTGEENEFCGGEYLVRVTAPKDFPANPPSFYFMTENGLYKPEEKVCISIGEYHKDQYRAALKMSGFCQQLVSGLIGWRDMGGGINIVKTTAAQKSTLARQSTTYNATHHSNMIRSICENYNNYSQKWDK